MGRRHVDGSDAARQRINHQPVLIYRHADDAKAERFEHPDFILTPVHCLEFSQLATPDRKIGKSVVTKRSNDSLRSSLRPIRGFAVAFV
jgi:hypothetical protein